MRRLAPFLVLAIAISACGEVVRLQAPTPTASSSASASPSAPASPTASPTPTAPPTPIAEVIAQIDPAKLDGHMRALADTASRDPRHPGHAKAVAYIKQQLAAIAGVTVTEQLASYQGIPLDNIFAVIEPLATEGRIPGEGIICAHYDSTAILTPGWRPDTDPAPGADDNATGTAALLEMVRILASQRASLHQTVRLAFFDGEELFFKGSAAYLSSLGAPLPFTWVLNIDMVGFNPLADRLDLVYYTDRSSDLRDRVKAANDRYAIGVSPIVPQLATSGATILDAAPFGLAGIPAIALVERYGEKDGLYPGNPQFHTVNDTPDKVTNTHLWLKAAKLTLATALELLRQ